MKRIYYFFKAYFIDIVVAIIGALGVLFAWIYGQGEVIRQTISLLVIFVTLLIIIYLRSRKKDFLFSALTWRRDKEKWIGYGTFQLSRVCKAYEIVNADPGYIISDGLTWSDYSLSFDFKIGNKCLGVIVRGVNLANYVMLQITQSGIRPHIRINGGWKWWEVNESELEIKISPDKWYHARISCDKSEIFIKITCSDGAQFDRVWNIPTGNLVFNFKKDESDTGTNIPFPINLEYGSVGFRNWGDEKAFVKNVLVEKI
ncbi:MAG: hypothetical protein UV05_C0057G0005 [candidate division CPR1 bacterium GW2011_GWA2_42_17]|uniref:Uncharacterized protein n=1 Tax=candidate division CPR1 bacterium GW2011_GWA2_42_17 TaxID=1618341 RepID=A0A0G1B4L0_9BACT|nr:MAG: hypothetical protein UV05_C0057G0005 [candidate division CPR1 bacterium GW2011_GWA2_42_17]